MTLPINYSWSPVGERLKIAYEAPQGRRVNAIGGYFSAGPSAGKFVFETRASIPKKKPSKQVEEPTSPTKRRRRRKTAAPAPQSGQNRWHLAPEEIGAIDAQVFLGFIWQQVAGRPAGAGADWRREVPVAVVLDNYSVHKSDRVKAEIPLLEAAGVYFFYLPAYSPKLSQIEPIWQAVKYKEMPERSFDELFRLKRAVEAALADKARRLAAAQAEAKTKNLLPVDA